MCYCFFGVATIAIAGVVGGDAAGAGAESRDFSRFGPIAGLARVGFSWEMTSTEAETAEKKEEAEVLWKVSAEYVKVVVRDASENRRDDDDGSALFALRLRGVEVFDSTKPEAERRRSYAQAEVRGTVSEKGWLSMHHPTIKNEVAEGKDGSLLEWIGEKCAWTILAGYPSVDGVELATGSVWKSVVPRETYGMSFCFAEVREKADADVAVVQIERGENSRVDSRLEWGADGQIRLFESVSHSRSGLISSRKGREGPSVWRTLKLRRVDEE